MLVQTILTWSNGKKWKRVWRITNPKHYWRQKNIQENKKNKKKHHMDSMTLFTLEFCFRIIKTNRIKRDRIGRFDSCLEPAGTGAL